MTSPVDWEALRRRLSGTVLLAPSPAWDRARRPQMQRFAEVQPLAVIRCADVDDVATALDALGGLPLAIRSGGHDFAGRSVSTGVVLDIGPIDHVEVSGQAAVVGAGAGLGDLYRALDRHGRTIPGGCGATVGVAGLTLGGGLGILGRSYGLTCDSLRSARVVLADGRIVTCDEQHDADLFWALRGAGAGYFGVVTELVFDTVAAPRCAVFTLTWDADQAARVLAAWQVWAPDAPPEMAASLLLNLPADPALPLRVTLFGAAHDIGAAELLDEFVSAVGAGPSSRWQQSAPWLGAKELLTTRAPGDGDSDGRNYSKSEFHDRLLPADAIDELIAGLVSDRVAGEARELDLSPWAGAYNALPVDATAFPHRRARFLLKHAATLVTDDVTAPSPWLTRSWQIAHSHGTGGVYPNFPDPDLADPARAYFGPNLARLHRIKQHYDPNGVLAPLNPR